MTQGISTLRYRTVSASLLLKALGDSLTDIASEDSATDADLGATLGKSRDSAERYRKGHGEMGAIAFLRGCAAWDGRFANRALALVGMKLVPLEAGGQSDRQGVTSLMRAVLSLQEALEDDDIVDDVELAQRRALVEDAGRVIDRYRERLRPRAVG